MKKKRQTDCEHQEIKNEVKTIIKKIEEKDVNTEQSEIESEDEEIFVGFDSEGKPVMLKECSVVVEDLLCDQPLQFAMAKGNCLCICFDLINSGGKFLPSMFFHTYNFFCSYVTVYFSHRLE